MRVYSKKHYSMKIFTTLITLLLAQALNAQSTFDLAYDFGGSELPVAITQDGNENYWVLSRGSIGNSSAILLHVDSSGDTLWAGKYINSALPELGDVEIMPDGTGIIAGISAEGTGILTKVDYSYQSIWSKDLGGTAVEAIALCSDADILAINSDHGPDPNSETIANFFGISKFDTDGNFQWGRKYNGLGSLHSLTVLTDDRIAGLGRDNLGLYVAVFDSLGIMQVKKTVVVHGGTDRAGEIVSTPDGGFAVCFTAGISGNDTNLCCLKFTSTASIDWAKVFADASYSTTANGLVYSSGTYTMCGRVKPSGSSYAAVLLMKLDSGGNIIATQVFDQPAGFHREGTALVENVQGGYGIACTKSSPTYNQSIFGTMLQLLTVDVSLANNCGTSAPQISEQAVQVSLTLASASSGSFFPVASSISPQYIVATISTLCGSTSLEDLNEVDIQVFPNPTASRLKISGAPVNSSYKIVDTTGRLVMIGTKLPVDGVLNVSELPQGLYHIVLESNSKETQINQSFVKFDQ